MQLRLVARRLGVVALGCLVVTTVGVMPAAALTDAHTVTRTVTRTPRNVFAFGGASFYGSTGATALSHPIVGIAPGSNRRRFWLAGDGLGGPKVEAAIAWFESRIGTRAYEGLCETTVELAYGTINEYPTANADWYAQPNHRLDWADAPRGALVFYDTGADGHVAISLGDGFVLSSSANHQIDVVPIGYFQNPLGWVVAPW